MSVVSEESRYSSPLRRPPTAWTAVTSLTTGRPYETLREFSMDRDEQELRPVWGQAPGKTAPEQRQRQVSKSAMCTRLSSKLSRENDGSLYALCMKTSVELILLMRLYKLAGRVSAQ